MQNDHSRSFRVIYFEVSEKPIGDYILHILVVFLALSLEVPKI